VRSSETIFSPRSSAFELPHTIANGDCFSKLIGDSNHE
jgi:hypothetical protein